LPQFPALPFSQILSARAVELSIGAFRVPPFLLPIYQAAGIDYEIPWQVLAAINEVESDYGRNLSTSAAGAVGWMQFLPSTWAKYGLDADGDGVANPYDPIDAIFSAARYLHDAGAPRKLQAAIFAYNHAVWYVTSVLLRARLLETMPDSLVNSLTGLMQARFPIAGNLGRFARRDPTMTHVAGQPAVVVRAPAGAPVIAVADGHVTGIGENAAQGRYVTLEDAYGNRFTYSGLGSVKATYPVVTPRWESAGQIAKDLSPHGRVARIPGPLLLPAPTSTPTPAIGPSAHPSISPARPLLKERLFADPGRRASYAAGGKLQLRALAAASGVGAQWLTATPGVGDNFSQALDLSAGQYTLARLRRGSAVVTGTILGRLARPGRRSSASMLLTVRPAGATAAVDVRPVVAGWAVLGRLTASRPRHGRAHGAALFGGRDPSIGQLLLSSKSELMERVLSDKRVTIYSCGRRDIEAGLVDRRVLAAIEYLSHLGFAPGVSGLVCGRANEAAAAFGPRLEISRLRGRPVQGHQQDGGSVDEAIRRLLQLQGVLAPTRIVSLRKYAGESSTVALSDHNRQLEVDFSAAIPGFSGTSVDQLRTAEWRSLMARLAQLSGTGTDAAPGP
jgi:hypothetical protein